MFTLIRNLFSNNLVLVIVIAKNSQDFPWSLFESEYIDTKIPKSIKIITISTHENILELSLLINIHKDKVKLQKIVNDFGAQLDERYDGTFKTINATQRQPNSVDYKILRAIKTRA